MTAGLFRKECMQIAKSLIFWLYVVCLFIFYNSQMGGMRILLPPQEGQEEYYQYGFKTDVSEQDIMRTGAGKLVLGYYYDDFITYPVGYAKHVSLSEEEKEEIAGIIYDVTGLEPQDMEADIASYFEENNIETMPYEAPVRQEVSYDEFLDSMKKVADILGPGSDFTEGRLKAGVQIPVDYEGAKANYKDLTDKDRLTGGYARLFCDYMGVMLGILPVFVTAARMLRDRRAQMQELVYVRRASSASVMGSRWLALVFMHMLPVLILSLLPTAACIRDGVSGVDLDYLAWLKYDLGWLLPTVMAVISVGMFFTELTETALAVLVQAAWWFISLMGAMTQMRGGIYGWNLVPRHNTELNYSGFAEGFDQLMANRIMYAVLAAVFLGLTIFVYGRKRKGHLRRHGKVSRNHKSPA